MRGTLHRPHAKEYCVKYQTDLGTLKGIKNDWVAVPANGSCSWENQQHGRGHHVKVVLRNLQAGTTINLKLVHEDGSEAPAFTVTKTGGSKPTMLIGADPREWRAGLSWTTKNREGPRRWHPAANCSIKVVGRGTDVPINKNPLANLCFLACSDDPLVIPVRIEVLSAVKGAGNYSRYCIQCTSTPTLDNEPSKMEQSLVPTQQSNTQVCAEDATSAICTWNSPPILIEAKWLPAAPVREHNKKRFNKGTSSDQASKPTNTTSSKTRESSSKSSASSQILWDAIYFLRTCTDPPSSSKESQNRQSTKKSKTGKASHSKQNSMEKAVVELEKAIQDYRLRTAFSKLPIAGDSSDPVVQKNNPTNYGTTVSAIGFPAAVASSSGSPYRASPPRSPAKLVKQSDPTEKGMFEKFEMLASAASDFSRLAALSPTMAAVNSVNHAFTGKMAPLHLSGQRDFGMRKEWNGAVVQAIGLSQQMRPPAHMFHYPPSVTPVMSASSRSVIGNSAHGGFGPSSAASGGAIFGRPQQMPQASNSGSLNAEAVDVAQKVNPSAVGAVQDVNADACEPSQKEDAKKTTSKEQVGAVESESTSDGAVRSAKSPPMQAWAKRVRTNSWAQKVQVPAIHF